MDCGTFLSKASIGRLRSQNLATSIHPISDAGHFVFHTREGQQTLAEHLASFHP